jgi:hypothetical protein
MLLTGLPAGFVRSPDCTILRFLFATSQNRKASRTRAMNSSRQSLRNSNFAGPHYREIIQTQTLRFCRVSYHSLRFKPDP